jgi:DNA invertase Pin-like site-specific DNA recombinase
MKVLPGLLSGVIMANHDGGRRRARHVAWLTNRQIEIIGLAAQGMPAGEIARRLGISPRTVENHVSTARTRTGARNLTELVARCYASGILSSGLWPPLTGPRMQPLQPASPGDTDGAAVSILQGDCPTGRGGQEPEHSGASSSGAGISRCLIGLACLSTDSQDAQRQRDALAEAGCGHIFEEKVSARNTGRRTGLAAALDHLQPGGQLCVCRLDRLGRRLIEVWPIATELHKRGAGLRILTGVMAGNYTPAGEGKFFFTVTAAFVQLERATIRRGTLGGIRGPRL